MSLVILLCLAALAVSPVPPAGAHKAPARIASGVVGGPGVEPGYRLAGSDGGVFDFGSAGFLGNYYTSGAPLAAPIVGLAATPDDAGYWLVGADGGVFNFGDAPFEGSLPRLGVRPNAPIVGIAATPDGQGYWLVAADGGVFAFGDAAFYGSMGGIRLNAPIVGVAPTHDGQGYWLAAADGGVFAFGDAPFLGSTVSENVGPLTGPVVGIVPGQPNRPSGGGLPAGPAVTGITPPNGPSAGGNLVTIEGSDLAGATAVAFGQVAAISFSAGPGGTSIAAVAPPGAGIVDVTVTTPAGQTPISAADRYSYLAASPTAYTGASLSLSPAVAGPDVPHTSQALAATLTDRNGKPLADMLVAWAVSGANRASGIAATNGSGQARFSYLGSEAGTDTVSASFSAGPYRTASNPATVTWVAPTRALVPLSISPVTGDFFAESTTTTVFTASPGDTPAFSQSFPDIEFNPPAGVVPGDTSGVTPATRPFTDITTNGLGDATGRTVAQGNGRQAGAGSMAAFDAALQGSFSVAAAGTQTLELFRSDGFILGVGGGATAGAGNVDVNPPAGGKTPFAGLAVMASDNQIHGADIGPVPVTVTFSAPGSYPFELDYLERSGASGTGPMTLALTTASTASGLKVSFAYADNATPPAAGTFPSPWAGSPGVSFVGGPGPFDSGAIQLQNTTSAAIPLDGVTVDIGTHHYAPWANSTLSVPAGQTLILAGSGTSFDTSEADVTSTTTGSASGFSFTTYASAFPSSGIGPVGMAQDPAGNLDVIDYNTGGLYRLGPSGGAVSASDLVTTYNTTPVGLAYSLDYRHLYMAERGAGQVVEIDPVTGQVLRTVATNLGAGGLAMDPTTGDLIDSAAGESSTIWIIANPQGTTPTVTSFNAGTTIDGIAVGPDGTIYGDTCCGSGFLMLSGAGSAQPGTLIKDVQSSQLYGTDGIALLPPVAGSTTPAVVQNSNNGVIFEIDDPLAAAPTVHTIYTGGTRGDFVTVGADGCLYASQSSTILKGTASDGSCPFLPFSCPVLKTAAQVHVTVAGQTASYSDTGLALTSGGVDGDHCGGTNESVAWTAPGAAPPSGPPVPPRGALMLSPPVLGDHIVGGAVSLAVQAMLPNGQPATGIPVTVAVTGPNARQLTATTDATGVATLSYTGTSAGLDSLVATAPIAGEPAVSNSLEVGWYVPVPATPPGSVSTSGVSPPSVTGLSPGQGADITGAVAVSAVISATGSPVASWSAVVTPHGGGAPTAVGSGSGTPPPTLGTFNPAGLAAGLYDLTVSATSAAGGTGSAVVTVSVDAPAPPAPPLVTLTAPTAGSVITAPASVEASVSAPSGQSIATWSVTYQAAAAGSEPITLASGSGPPPAQVATFDPTLVADGAYVLTVSAQASGGGTAQASTAVTVAGNLKIGRYVNTYTDLSVPVNGFQMTVQRIYDSTNKTTGDFGVGWHLGLSNFTVTTNRALGAGGWSQYDPMCFGALCTTAYRSATPHTVTVTWPDGHAEVFDFTPTGGTVLFPSIGPAFTARPGTGTSSSLTTSDPIAGMTATGDLVDANGNDYEPTRYTLTTRTGQVLVLDTTTGLVSEADRSGNALTVDATGVHASNGESLTFTRDAANRITAVTGPSGQQLAYGYSASGDLASFTDAAGHTTTYSYDASHDLTGATGPNGKPIQSLQYDASGRLIGVTNGDGQTVSVANDVAGRRQVVTSPDGKLTTIDTYDTAGDVVSQTLSFGTTTATSSFTYDAEGHLLSSTDPLGHTTSTTYDSLGNPVAVTGPNGAITTTSYDSLGRPIVVTGPAGTPETAITYDAAGNPATLAVAGERTYTLGHDAAGHLTSFADPSGATTTLSYAPAGQLASITDPTGALTAFTTNSSGQVLAVTDASGHTVHYSYDPNGSIASVTDANGHTTTYTYDVTGALVSKTDPLNRVTTYAYDPAGHLVSSTNPDGKTTTYAYDAEGRPITITPPGGGTEQYSYDPLGRLVSATDPAATVTFAYDSANRVVSQSTSGPGQPSDTLGYTYDVAGNRTAMTGPAGTTRYSYDPASELVSITDPAGGTFQFGHDPSGALTGLSRPNGVNDAYSYNPNGNVSSIVSQLGAVTVASVGYTYDAAGRRTSATGPGGTTTYSYDALGRLTKATPPTGPALIYAYDPAGNPTATPSAPAGSLSYDAADQLLAGPGTTHTYNGEGQLTATTATGTNQTTQYQWDGLGQLSGVVPPTGPATTYGYDALGRRVSTTTAGITQASLYDGANLLATESPAGGTQTFVDGAGLNTPLETNQPGGGAYYYLNDALGSTTALTDAAGSIVKSYTYSPYGSPTGAGSASVNNPLTYTGQAQDPTGLYYYHDRYYDPAAQRFLSTDPAPANNPYTYANASPINFSDPTGADAVETALLFQYDQAIANDFQALINGITNYLVTCAAAELTPGTDSSLACSKAFLSASIIYNEVQAADATGLGLVVSNPFLALVAGALFNGVAAAGQSALDQSLTGPLTLAPIATAGGTGVREGFAGGIINALAGGSGTTSDPLEFEAPTTTDIVAFEGTFLVNSGIAAHDSQCVILTYTSGSSACS